MPFDELEHTNPDEEEDDSSRFEALIEFLKSLPRPEVSILNQKRAEEMKIAYQAILKAVDLTSPGATIVCDQSEYAPDVGRITIEGVCIEIKDSVWFQRAASFSDNSEVYPLVNGKVRMTLGFNNMTIPIRDN